MLDTTGDLVAICATQPGDPNYASAVHMCQGYLLGVHHFHTALSHEIDEDIYCVNPDKPRPTRDQVVAEFVEWSQAHPETADKEALEGLLTWASTAYPCS
ncbi:MAG: Rap1a/Tai family immunity protein [Pseudomonadota bacterium]